MTRSARSSSPIAGWDARAFRHSWPDGTQLHDLDRPEVLALKDELLRAAAALPAAYGSL